jgi:hypothetical protein
MMNEGFGSYDKEDVVFLLKDLSGIDLEGASEEREKEIQSGRHYSETLPIEERPGQEYMELFWSLLDAYKKEVALYTGITAEQIYHTKGRNTVLVSLARAGTPVGILIKRYIRCKYEVDLPHYSISIIRGKGIDENAIRYIIDRHAGQTIQFIDGWTGKGAISIELQKSVKSMAEKYGFHIDNNIAVLADPGHCSTLFGIREDFLLPSACLNSTVSGLVSRTVLNDAYIKPGDFHGAKYYQEFESIDVSRDFIEVVCKEFPAIYATAEEQGLQALKENPEADFKGMETVKRIGQEFAIENINLIKPGVGETTRVLLRRIPWKILVRDFESPYIRHIVLLAKVKKVELVHYPDMDYACCGLIKQLKE